MNNQRTFLFLGLVVALSIFIGLFREPHYQGRSLTSWLQQCSEAAGNETQRIQQAEIAMRSIGARRALPVILSLVKTKDDPVSQWLIDKSDKYRYRLLATFRWESDVGYDFFRPHDAREFQLYAIAGFKILGTNAAPAAPQLEKLLNDQSYDFVIKRSLLSIGKPSEPVYCRGLTNQDADIRDWSIDALLDVTDDVGVYITRIKPRLHDPSEAVRAMAVDAIGWQTNVPELALPLLADALNDPSDFVSSHAADALSGFSTYALPFFLTLSNLAENGSPATARNSLKTLLTINPTDAFPILTNHIAHGKSVDHDVLQALANAAPDQALPLLLSRLQSPDLKIKNTAFGLLLHYPASPPVQSAMIKIATGSDSELVPRKKGYLTDDYVARHPEVELFADEPVVNGRRLGEWLKTRNGGSGDFSPAAKTALHELGTNAMPALFKRLTYAQPPYCFGLIQININAASAFIALDDQAKGALPDLFVLMDSTNKDVALTAMIASLGTGSNAMPFLIKGLTNQFPNVRNLAANILSDDFGNKYPEQRRQAVPLFVKLLSDLDDDVRGSATNELKTIDPIAAARAGIK